MNRNDRRVLIAALIVGVIVLTGIFFLGGKPSSNPSKEREDEVRGKKEKRVVPYAVTPLQQPETFYFDPNTADSTQLLRLGLQPWQVRNIYKYRAKGGVYRKKEDFARLYGLTVKDYRRLEPYIRISSDYLPAATLLKEEKDGNNRSNGNYGNNKHNENNNKLRYPVKIRENEHIVLNMADTAQLQRVPGIGKYYAKEIVRYGQWLGGYVSVDQLDEIDQFPKEAKKFFIIQHSNPHKLNVNKLTLQQLRCHPYINYYQAKAITDYRRLHGKIEDIRQLRFSSDFVEKDFQRLIPYIEY
ncbi:MAG: helix-hairpin-helix domain-containing protein [Prevotella sp.]|nr:helix-hairpin-helix domain-containing protein [Prevotella sp.]